MALDMLHQDNSEIPALRNGSFIYSNVCPDSVIDVEFRQFGSFIDLDLIAGSTISMTNPAAKFNRENGWKFVIPDLSDAQRRLEINNLKIRAFSEAGIPQDLNQDLTNDHYRGTKHHGPIVYLGVNDSEGNLVAHFSMFQINRNEGYNPNIDEWQKHSLTVPQLLFLFRKELEEYNELPLFAASILVRDPVRKADLAKAGSPHRTLLTALAVEFGTSSEMPQGYLILTQAQLATVNLLRSSLFKKAYPGYQIIGDMSLDPTDKHQPHAMLLFFPHLDKENALCIRDNIPKFQQVQASRFAQRGQDISNG